MLITGQRETAIGGEGYAGHSVWVAHKYSQQRRVLCIHLAFLLQPVGEDLKRHLQETVTRFEQTAQC